MRILRRILRTPEGVLGTFILCGLVFVAITALWIAPYDSRTLNLRERLKSPSSIHLLGTDAVRRDLLSRVMNGVQVSLQARLTIVSLACVAESPLGLISEFLRKATSILIMRIIDIFFAFTALVLAIAVVVASGAGLSNGLIAVSLVWCGCELLIHAQVLSLREESYVEAVNSTSASSFHILLRHILPNAMGPSL